MYIWYRFCFRIILHRKTDLKKVKGRRKKKRASSSSSSSSSSEDSEDEDGLDPSLYDLNTPLFSIAKYIKNPDEMVKEMFRLEALYCAR